jgi:hypothetical protein
MIRMRSRRRLRLLAATATVCVVACGTAGVVTARAQQQPTKSLDEVIAMMARAGAAGRVGTAQKTRPVDARPAKPGEVVVTMIKDEGKETTSKPANTGDWVVRNRCPDTGNEEYLVAADKFPGRYRAAGPAVADGWQAFTPVGKMLRFLVLAPTEAPFEFVAPWGEKMVARLGDAMVQDPGDERDVYRVAQSSFQCTYDVVTAPAHP